VLSRGLAEQGHYPAIDVEASISRAMNQLVSESEFAKIREFKQLYSRYSRARDLISVGAYSPGSDPQLDRAIALFPQVEGYLQQNIRESTNYSESRRRLVEVLS
jgi:flagellum-specific ATP synthase